VQAVNIYSFADTYQTLANRILFLGFGQSTMPGALNIELSSVRHSDFNHNLEVQWNGTKEHLFDLYRKFLAVV
jgi:hypothetical protein